MFFNRLGSRTYMTAISPYMRRILLFNSREKGWLYFTLTGYNSEPHLNRLLFGRYSFLPGNQ